MKTSKRIAAALMSAVMAVGMIPAAMAADVDANSGVGSVPVALSQSATTFSVTIPTTLPVAVTADHAVSTATDAHLVNNSYGPIQVKAVAVNEQNGWDLVSYDTDFRKVKVNAKQFGMELQGVAVDPSGEADASAFQSIDGRKSLPLTYDAVVAAQSAAVNATVANVVFTIGWDEGALTPSEPEVQYTDFEVLEDNRAAVGYTGEPNETLVIPSTFVGDGNNGTEAGVNYKVTSIGECAFDGCTGLTSVTIPEGVTSIGNNAFQSCRRLTSVTIPDSVTSIGDRAFLGCRRLTSVTIPDSVTSIGSYAFRDCTELNEIIVASGNTVYDSRNNCNAIIETATNTLIQGCQTTVIPEGVTSIGDGAFDGCSGLTSMDIPSSVISIGAFAFSECTVLTDINFGGTQEQWNAITKDDDWDFDTDSYTIHCSDGDLAKS